MFKKRAAKSGARNDEITRILTRRSDPFYIVSYMRNKSVIFTILENIIYQKVFG